MAVGSLANRLAITSHYRNRGYAVNIKELAVEFSISELQIQDLLINSHILQIIGYLSH